jgi:hypothetical protein
MGLLKKVLGPLSKYDRSLPYTYVAKYAAIPGDEESYLYYFSDTICGLIETLEENNLSPGKVVLFGVYEKEEIEIPTGPCVDEEGGWLSRPDICASLEESFEKTKDERYRGHVQKGACSFDDRDRDGEGPC